MSIFLSSTSIYPLTVLKIDDFRYIYIGYKSMWLKALEPQIIKQKAFMSLISSVHWQVIKDSEHSF